jgi:hypothetical protein
MANSNKRDWLQIGGFGGVIVGLLLVAYEVRQANDFAQAETLRGIFGTYDSIQLESFNSDIFEIYIKSYESPDSLTDSEIMRLDSWFTLMMGYWNQRMIMQKAGLNPRDTIQDFEGFYDYIFGSSLSIAWYSRNKAWMEPELVEVADRFMIDRPVRSVPPLIEELKSEMSKMK